MICFDSKNLGDLIFIISLFHNYFINYINSINFVIIKNYSKFIHLKFLMVI